MLLLVRYHCSDPEMQHTATDPAVFFHHGPQGALEGLSVLQVDDSLITRTKDFLDQPSEGGSYSTHAKSRFRDRRTSCL